MMQNGLKRYTAYAMGAIVVLIVIWAIFGTRGNAVREVAPAPLAATNVQTAPASQQAEAEPKASAEPENKMEEATETPEASPERSNPDENRWLAMLSPRDTIRSLNRYEAHFDSMPPGGIKMRINSVGGTLGRVFNDSNYLHIASAEAIGVRPLHTLRDAWEQGAKLERLQSCEAYYLDNLVHSRPFLVPRAHKLLTDIGMAFRDSLQRRGGGDYRIKVTSVLRTPRLVKRLRRANLNAVDTSAHLYGTTFDISYAKFICDSTRMPRTQEDLKNLLAEVVADMRRQGRCYVKYERKQACFHITAR